MQPTDAGQIALGTMYLGTRQDRDESYAILDRFVERGGRWLDTADNYAFWESDSGRGGDSEEMVGAWLADHPGARDEVWLSTKVGADPTGPGDFPASAEGLGHEAVTAAFGRSLQRLGTDRVELLWAHIEDRTVPLEEQVATLGGLVAEGRVGRLGASNHASWRVERARAMARERGLAAYSVVQLRHTYLQPIPFAALPDVGHVVATPEALDLVATEGLGLWAYTSLLGGAYARPERLQDAYRHADTDRRIATLERVAGRLDATVNQVVLAWLLGSAPAVTPIVGVSGTAQLDEAMDALDLVLDEEVRAELDGV